MRHALLIAGVALASLFDPAPCRAQNPTELPEGKKLIALEGRLMQARWSQDGKTVVTCSTRTPQDDKDNTYFRFKRVDVWDVATGKQVSSLGEVEHPGYPSHYLSADGARLVISQNFFLSSGEMEIWDARRAELRQKIPVERKRRPSECVVVSPKGDFVADIYGDVSFMEAAVKGNGGINVHDAATGKHVQTLRVEDKLQRTAVFTPDGRGVISRGTDDVVRLWDVKTGKVLRQAQASLGSGGELALSPDGKTLVIPTTKQEPTQLWTVPEFKALPTITNPFHTVMLIEFSPGGKRLMIAGFREEPGPRKAKFGVMVWDLEQNKLLHDWNTPSIHCGFCGEDRLGVGDGNAILCYPIGAAAKKAGQ
jgi:WD40 repeat protein